MNFKLLVLFSMCYSAVYATTTAVPEPEPTEVTEAETAVTGETTGAPTTTVPATTGPTTAKASTTKSVVTTNKPACVDKSTDCVNKKSLCQTTGYVDFMADLCPVSCGYCGAGACADTRPQCAVWKQNGYCENRYYTTESKRESCAKTCNLCKAVETKPPCVDTDTRCVAWNKNGYCANTFYTAADKKKGCAKTCGLC